jgi:hypothetical protein
MSQPGVGLPKVIENIMTAAPEVGTKDWSFKIRSGMAHVASGRGHGHGQVHLEKDTQLKTS